MSVYTVIYDSFFVFQKEDNNYVSRINEKGKAF